MIAVANDLTDQEVVRRKNDRKGFDKFRIGNFDKKLADLRFVRILLLLMLVTS
jgi:hypothetical protein